jgi:hypothetical protein
MYSDDAGWEKGGAKAFAALADVTGYSHFSVRPYHL